MTKKRQKVGLCTRTGMPVSTIFIVEDNVMVREALTSLLANEGHDVKAYSTATDFLNAYQPETPGCLLLDINLPDISGIELQTLLAEQQLKIPIIFLTGQANVPITIQAFRNGAIDLLEKPVSNEMLLERINEALTIDANIRTKALSQSVIWQRVERLTKREREVMALLASGYSNKQMAQELDISSRTVEIHRRRVYEKTGVESLAELIDLLHVIGYLKRTVFEE
ncbi:MAG: response regulator [Candidatus Thiodiazotropha lotti]|uniref:Response regulator n=1 Tax=Candidatus Thiodiazotropha lotti TaxID=2792787 RepID=A0A9E4K5E1_9GAMM|nr:response regulator [Candidatus Thiodiazotropha lotti]MCG7931395.1 response regulator [Candidatus Thiodiazotropha lotti]MCG7939030.1 response regulator [Candidatus Thiodiazotropha lotti]MCG8003645.1 response regulator [Candidatus Thiodiazotropha lotti]MCG8008274.1 response regulator [Candidatus Thiodiazotropha lotti]